MSKPAAQFEPIGQVDQTLTEFEEYMLKAKAAIERLSWLKDKIAADLDAAAAAADAIEIYTEEQAAAMMQIKPSQLAALRRRHRFEYINFGSFVRYNRAQIIAICEFLTLDAKPVAGGIKLAVVKRAA